MQITTCLAGIHYGTGRHMDELEPENVEMALMVRPSYKVWKAGLTVRSTGICVTCLTPLQ